MSSSPKFIVSEGEDFEVEFAPRGNSNTRTSALKVDGTSGKVTNKGSEVVAVAVNNGGNLLHLACAFGNAAGARTLTGAKVGDKVLAVINVTDATTDNADYESTITVVDQIQQTAVNHTGDLGFVVLLRPTP
jgi:hypothetical protein